MGPRSYNPDMPTYEYACLSCGAHVEVYQRITEDSLTRCGVCGGPLRKVFHPAGILFKGSGFYKTDSRASRAKAADGGKTSEAVKSSDSGLKAAEGTKPVESPAATGDRKGQAGSETQSSQTGKEKSA